MKTKIASIFFAPLRAERRAYGGKYELPAVAKGEPPALLHIPDMVERWRMPMGLGDGSGGNGATQTPIFGEQIANDLIQEWSKSGMGMNEVCHPGIWIVRERMIMTDTDGRVITDQLTHTAVWRPATEQERREMWAEDYQRALEADRAYAEYLISEGDRIDSLGPKARRAIPPNCKVAATHYGLARDWNRQMTSSDMGPCPYCEKVISLSAIKCSSCQEIVNVEKYARLVASRDAAVREARKELVSDKRIPQRSSTGLGLKPSAAPSAHVVPPAPAGEMSDEEIDDDFASHLASQPMSTHPLDDEPDSPESILSSNEVFAAKLRSRDPVTA